MWAVASLAWIIAMIQPTGQHEYRQYCYEQFGQYACLVPVTEDDEFAGFYHPPSAVRRVDDGWRTPSSFGLWLLIALPPLLLLGAGAFLLRGANTTINWDRGLFRLWLVLSALLIIIGLFWMQSEANRARDYWVQLLCDPLRMTLEEWRACYRDEVAHRGDTRFESQLRWNWWLLPGGTFLIAFALVVAAGLWKAGVWLLSGFTRNPD